VTVTRTVPLRQGLRAQPWWDAGEFPWVRMLEANAHVFREELAGLEFGNVGGRSMHDGTLVSSGVWSEFLLFSSGGAVAANCKRCPRTAALLMGVPAAMACATAGVGEALFSVLAPGTSLRPHCGSTNTRLTCHLGLSVPDGCELRVGDEPRAWAESKALVFDDSFLHEAHNTSAATRIVLLINFFHPELPPREWGALNTHASADAAPFRA
jgi:aspartate beta-hydroxylase